MSSLQNFDMRSISYLARLWVYDQLYRICYILVEYWSFGNVICIVCRFYHSEVEIEEQMQQII